MSVTFERDMQYKGFTDEQNAKAAELKTPAELLAFAKEEGVELPDSVLDQVSGSWGAASNSGSCPKCNSDKFWIKENGSDAWCGDCGYEGKASWFFNHSLAQ